MRWTIDTDPLMSLVQKRVPHFHYKGEQVYTREKIIYMDDHIPIEDRVNLLCIKLVLR